MVKKCHVCDRPIYVLVATCDVCTELCCYECLMIHHCNISDCFYNKHLLCKTCDHNYNAKHLIESKIDIINNKL